MPEELKEQPMVEPAETKTENSNEVEITPTLEDVIKQNAELMKSLETQKKEIAGINKANTDANTKYNDLLKQHESDDEKKDRETRELNDRSELERNDFINQKAEFNKKENNFNVRVKALELGFTADDITALDFNSVESVEKYKSFLDSKLQASKESHNKEIESTLSGTRGSYDKGKNTEQLTPLEMKIINGR